MPNKTVLVDPNDLGDINETVVATFDRGHIPYAGEHVDVACSYRVGEEELILSRTGVVENINHEHITCLVRLTDQFPSNEAIANLAQYYPKVDSAEESGGAPSPHVEGSKADEPVDLRIEGVEEDQPKKGKTDEGR